MSKKIFCYLAGPITGCTEDQAVDWREYVKSKLNRNIIGVSPLRGEPAPENGTYTPTDQSKFRSSKAIAAKNHYDTHNCDVVLAYLPKETNENRPSYGTIFELGWATGIQTPTILVTDDPTIREHPLFDAKINWIVSNLDDAIEIINTMFDVYVGNE